MKNLSRYSTLSIAALIAPLLLGVHCSAQAQNQSSLTRYKQTNLVSDQAGVAAHTDANLKNPWGIVFNPNGPVWIANNGTGTSSLFVDDGTAFAQLPFINVPGANGAGDPTGIVFNSSDDFNVTQGQNTPARFIFANESGRLAAWSPTVDFNNAILVGNTPPDAEPPIYKGLALAGNGKAHYLYATDFHNAKVQVFNNTFTWVNAKTTLGCDFSDTRIPTGFAPFGIQNINGNLYVTYAKQDANKEDDVPGQGLGFVNIFDSNGCLIRRFASRGVLNAPWGMALAPADFGKHSNRVLIGNFGDGTINAFSLEDGRNRGAMQTQNGQKIVIDGLWGLAFGNGVLNQPTNTLFFTAGPNDETHGLYGKIEATTSTTPGMGNTEVPGTGIGVIPNPGIGMVPNPGIGVIPNPGIGMVPNPGIGVIPNPGIGMVPNPGIGEIPGSGIVGVSM